MQEGYGVRIASTTSRLAPDINRFRDFMHSLAQTMATKGISTYMISHDQRIRQFEISSEGVRIGGVFSDSDFRS